MRWQRIASNGTHPPLQDGDPDYPHRAALESGDEVVQQLAIAKYALTVGDTERAMSAIDDALDVARRSLSELLGTARQAGVLSFAGMLVRSIAATSHSSSRDSSPPVVTQRAGTNDN